jgi:hypothetical protein
MCADQPELEQRVNRAARDLSSALDAECVAVLHNRPDVPDLQARVREAEREWLDAVALLRRHRAEHGC